MKKWILNYLGSPVKVIGAITYLFLMWGIWQMVEIGNVFVANIFLGFTCLLLYSGYDALESKKNKDG